MNLFTITKFRYPKHLEDTFDNFTFYYEHDKIYQDFFEENNTDIIKYETFRQIKNDYIKKICFAFYVLYTKGGFFIDINVIPDKNIYAFELEEKIYCVESILNNNSLFMGIFGSKIHNKNLIDLINKLVNIDNESFTSNILYKLLKNDFKEKDIAYLSEKVTKPYCVSSITPLGKELFHHYYDPKISYTIPFQQKQISSEKNIKIGITLTLLSSVKSFFSNGINQNTLFLCELLLNIGFDVYFIVEDTKLFTINNDVLKDILYDDRFKYVKYSEILYSEFNFIITLSFSYSDMFIYNYLKHMNTKHVGYFCGNTYIIETEKILYNQHKARQKDAYDFKINNLVKYDEIWCIPQMSETNLDFWSILYECKCIEVPFVWSNNAIKLFCKANDCKEETLYYKNRGPEKKIAIFEPNISIMKWALPSILICEEAYRKNKNVKHLYITNINSCDTNDFNIEQFNKLLKTFDIVKDKKCSIETRYTTLSFMSNHADVVISHQWGNPLNYLYFDLAWMGWPIIHNAYLCDDVGYFYKNFNLKEAAVIVDKVLKEHDLNSSEYLETNRKNIDRFLPTNASIQEKYKELVFNLLK
jgi:hypothetical protein